MAVKGGNNFEKTLTIFVEIEKCVRIMLPQHVIRGDSDKIRVFLM